MARRLSRHVIRVLGAWILVATSAAAQGAGDLEGRLASLSGLDRARALARLVDAHKIDDPARAIRYGNEAIKLFAVTSDPAANIATLNEMAWAHMTVGQYDSASFYADSGRRFAERVGDKGGQARAVSNLGSLEQRRGNPARAVALFGEALALQRIVGRDRDIANSLNNLGYVYTTDLADYSKGLAYGLEALAIRERLGDGASVSLSLNNIGIVYGRLRQYDRALTYFDRALQIRRAQANKTRIAATLNNIGDIFLEKGDLSHALSYHREALAIRSALDDRSAIALSHRNIGLVYLALKQPDAARRKLLLAKGIADRVGDKGLEAQIELGLAQCERQAQQPQQADEHARLALAIAEGMGSRDLVRQAADELGAIKESRGDLAAALQAFKRSKAVSDSIFNSETEDRIGALEGQYVDVRRMQEIDSLRRHQTELQLEARTGESQRDGAAALAILIAVVAFFLYRRRVERSRLAEAMSVTDALTGLWNRRYVQQTMQMDTAASLRRHRAALARGAAAEDADLIFLVLDLDHFKSVNDEFGHAVGDELLVQLAAVMRTTCRDSDIVVRWGGEEFLIVARFTNRMQAPVTAERLRQAIERHVMTMSDGRMIRLTCSIGFAAFPFDLRAPDALAWTAVLELADVATFIAKRDGRNAWLGVTRDRASGPGITRPAASVEQLERWIAEQQLIGISSKTFDNALASAPGVLATLGVPTAPVARQP